MSSTNLPYNLGHVTLAVKLSFFSVNWSLFSHFPPVEISACRADVGVREVVRVYSW